MSLNPKRSKERDVDAAGENGESTVELKRLDPPTDPLLAM